MDEDAPDALAPAPPATPFWQCMPRMFLFPLQRAPALRIGGATVFVGVAAWFAFPGFSAAPLRSFLLLFLAMCGGSLFVAQFAFLVIERSAFGYLDTGSYPQTGERVDWRRPVKMFLVMVLVPVLIIVAGNAMAPRSLVLLALLAFALLLPASVIVLTMTDSFSDAVNPLRCVQTAWSIGPPYLLLCLFLLLLLSGSQETLHLLLPASNKGAAAPGGVAAGAGSFAAAVFVATLVGNYFLVLTCALIGYAMFQYSTALGITVVGPGEGRSGAKASNSADARRRREALIGKSVAAGEYREAIELVSAEMRERPADLSLHASLHTLLLHEGNRERILAHAQRYLELLLAAGNGKESLAFFANTRSKFADFAPQDPAQRLRLAGMAIDALDPALAAELIRGFDRNYPGHPAIPDAYVLGARVMLQANRGEEAKKLLQHAATSYPQTPAAAEALRYLQRFEPAPRAPAGAKDAPRAG